MATHLELDSPSRSRSGSFSTSSGSLEEGNLVVGRSVKTKVLKKINQGSFGQIYLGELVADGRKVVVKLEYQNTKSPQLLLEGSIYRSLEAGPGVPKTFWFGMHEPLYNVLVMELLGPSLQDLFIYCKHRFTLKTVLLLIDQMVDIIEHFHNNKYVHRDIKPDNFTIGKGDHSDKIYIIDYGLAKKFTRHKILGHGSHFHVLHALVGTARYASVHAHLGHDDSPRDDLEALGYVWIYFLKGTLPWQGIQGTDRTKKFQQIKDMKINVQLKELCHGLPEEFHTYLNYCRHLRIEDVPDYDQMKKLFRLLAEKEGITYDNQYDWVKLKTETGQEYKFYEIKDEHWSSSA